MVQVFSCEFCEVLKNFFIEHDRWLLLTSAKIGLQYIVYLLTISLIHFLCIVRLTICEKCGFVSKNTWNYQTEAVASGRSVKNCVLKIFPKLTEKRLSRSLFFIKFEERKPSTLSKEDFGRDVFM